jgi:hypothetical protein
MFTILLSILLPLLYFSSLITPVHADDFNIIGDSNFNQYRQATTISIDTLPSTTQDSYNISYDTNLVSGYSTQEVLEQLTIEDITDMNYWRRVPDIADSVSGPPGTKIGISYFFYNQAGHEVEVSKVVIPFSKENREEGNWLNVALVNDPLPVQRSISMLWDNRNLTKSGLLKEYIGPGVLGDSVRGSLILDSVTISDPIKILDVQSDVVGNTVEMSVAVKNGGNEVLENLTFEHLTFSQNFTILPSQEIQLEYILEGVEDLGHFQIENPNEQTECAIQGIKKYQWVQTKGITVLAYREDGGGWVMGSYLIPEQESFCITRIPYTLTSSFLGYANIQVDDNMIEEEQEPSQEDPEGQGKEKEQIEEPLEEQEPLEELVVDDKQGDVLGVTEEEESENNFVLPKTGVIY